MMNIWTPGAFIFDQAGQRLVLPDDKYLSVFEPPISAQKCYLINPKTLWDHLRELT
jgi:hypothetical protein